MLEFLNKAFSMCSNHALLCFFLSVSIFYGIFFIVNKNPIVYGVSLKKVIFRSLLSVIGFIFISYPVNHSLLLMDLTEFRPLVMALYACIITTICFLFEGKTLPSAIGYVFTFTLAGFFAVLHPILMSELSYLFTAIPCGMAIGLGNSDSLTKQFVNSVALFMDNSSSNGGQNSSSAGSSSSSRSSISLAPQPVIIGNRIMYYHPGIGIIPNINRPNYIIVGNRVTDTTG